MVFSFPVVPLEGWNPMNAELPAILGTGMCAFHVDLPDLQISPNGRIPIERCALRRDEWINPPSIHRLKMQTKREKTDGAHFSIDK